MSSRFVLTLEIHEVPESPRPSTTRGGHADPVQPKRGEPISVLRVVTRGATLLAAIGAAVAHLNTAKQQEELELAGRERS
ncbi:MAG TPA: hypothetical protein VGE43_10295 [Acidimicrobiales bacterium]